MRTHNLSVRLERHRKFWILRLSSSLTFPSSVHSYVREGRAIHRIVSLADPVTNLIAEYDRRVMLEEDEDNIKLVASSDE